MVEQNYGKWSQIPSELRERPQWCLAGPDKRPLTVNGRPASVTNANTWTDFETASVSAALQGACIGYVQTTEDPFSCIDIDVKDTTSAEDMERFGAIIEQFDSYTERSKSGRGYHIWVYGKIGPGRRREGIEVYSQERFMICTGNIVRDRPVTERQGMLTNMMGQMNPEPVAAVYLWGDDCYDWGVATRAAEDDGEVGRLFCGDWKGRYPSQSEADLALVKLLLPLTESPKECWNTFRLSKLGNRDKAMRSDYAQSTIAMAVQHLAHDAEGLRHGEEMIVGLFSAEVPKVRRFQLLRDNQLDALPKLRWLVKGIIPDSGIGAIYGDSGTFKSFLTLDLLAHISNGMQWFGHRVKSAPAVYVPFEGQGGIPNRIKAWRLAQAAHRDTQVLFTVIPPDDIRSNIGVIMDPLNLREEADQEALVASLQEQGWSGGVLCIDTLAHASSGLDENSSAMAEMLTIFRNLQYKLGGLILVIHHSGKDQARGMRGWSGLHAAMDFVVECQHEKGVGNRQAHFALTKVKDGASGGKFGFAMQAIELGFDEDGDPIASLIVCPKQDAEMDPLMSSKNNAERDEQDDQFVWKWVKQGIEQGEFPSGRSLEGQREIQMNQEHPMTQKRLRDAISRLKAASRLVNSKDKAPSGNFFLVPV